MLMGIAPLLGAILATLGLLLAGSEVTFFFNLLVPLPIAALTLRQGLRPGFLALLVVTTILAAGAPADGIETYLLQYGMASLLLPLLLRRGERWDRAIALSWGGIIITVAIVIAADAAAQGTSLGTLVNNFIAQETGQLKELYKGSADLSAEQKEQLLKVFAEMEKTMVVIWPAVLALLGGLLLLIQLFLLSLFPATRSLLPGPAFSEWKTPDLLVWLMITAGFFAFFTTATIQMIAINLLVIIFPLYYLQGLAIVTFYFQQRGTSPWLRAGSYLLLALLNPLPFFLAGVGLFDLWGNFRKERVKPNSV